MSKLLIIGLGSHGKVVKEIADCLGIYKRIEFLDDNSDEAIGTIDELEYFRKDFDSAFVSIGDNNLREKFINELKLAGYDIPVLIHPTAYVSKSCIIKNGTLVEPKAIVNTNSQIGEGCIVSVGAIIDHDVVVEDYCHVNAGAVIKAGSKIDIKTKIDFCQIVG